MALKSVDDAVESLKEALPTIPARYERGIKAAKWKEAAASDQAEMNWSKAVAEAAREKRRAKAIAKLTDDDWRNAAINKGAPIIGDRINAAIEKYRTNFGAVYEKAKTTFASLPPRTTDWKTNVANRLMKVVEAWKKASGKV